jgi:hypothetical protein
VNIKKFICRVIGHKAIQYFDGRVQCARCDHVTMPVKGSRTIAAMKQHDPEWGMEYGKAPFAVGLEAFYQRNPDYGS